MNKKSNTPKRRAAPKNQKDEVIEVKKKVESRATGMVLEDRLHRVSELILSGYKMPDVVKVALAPIDDGGFGWDLTERQVATYYQRAYAMVTELPTKDELRGKLRMLIERYDMVLRLALEKRDIKTANSIIKNMGDLLPMSSLAAELAEIKKEEEVRLNFVSVDEIESKMADIKKSDNDE